MARSWRDILSLAVCLCLLCGMLSAPAAAEEAAVSVSEEMVSLVAQWEGFVSTYTGGYIGYGTAVSAGAFPNGITQEEAQTLLCDTLDALALQITGFFSARGVELSQQQLDALASLAYNTGTGWMNDSYRIVRTICSGRYTANELASALGVWCHVGKTVSPMLARHRAAEAAIFLFGDYSGTGDRFRYVIYDADGGDMETDIRFYQTGTTYVLLETAEREGFALTGWYTPDGRRLAAGDLVTENLTVTARWADGGADPADPSETTRFSDMTADSWYAGYVEQLASAGVVDGYGDGTFRPNNTVNRAQALKLVLLAAGYEPIEQPAEAGWAAGYYASAVVNGLLAEDRWPDLSQAVTRLEVAELACAALGLNLPGVASPFSDTDSAAAAALYQAGIFTGAQDASGGLIFSPDSTLTRAQASAVIWRMMEWKANADALEGY